MDSSFYYFCYQDCRNIDESKAYKSAIKVKDALPPQSIQRKVVLAILCQLMSLSNAIIELNIGRKSFETANRHYKYLLSGNYNLF